MYTIRLLWTLIFLGVVVQAVKKRSDVNPGYPLAVHMVNLESELQPDLAESTYIRVIVWDTMPTRERLRAHFDKFDLLQLEEERLANGKFDIIQKSESTYERFLYVHYPEQESFVTVFVKVNFDTQKNPLSLKYFIEKVGQTLKKYGLIDTVETVRDPVDSNNSNSSSGLSWINSILFFIFCGLIYRNIKGTGMILIIFHQIIPLIVLVRFRKAPIRR